MMKDSPVFNCWPSGHETLTMLPTAVSVVLTTRNTRDGHCNTGKIRQRYCDSPLKTVSTIWNIARTFSRMRVLTLKNFESTISIYRVLIDYDKWCIEAAQKNVLAIYQYKPSRCINPTENQIKKFIQRTGQLHIQYSTAAVNSNSLITIVYCSLKCWLFAIQFYHAVSLVST